MSAEEAQLTAEEQAAFDRVIATFPEATVGPFEPDTPAGAAGASSRPDAILPELAPIPLPKQMTDGLSFALTATASEEAIWGDGDAVACAPGEATLLIGPDGAGKTTLAHQLVLRRAGIGDELLGLRVTPAEGKILVVAADRPKQAARSLWRIVQALEDRRLHGRLKDAVLVWRGPLPFDLVKAPATLADWAIGFGSSDVFLDSLGFVAQRLSEDETGGAIAQAFVHAATAGLEIVALGHPRKAQAENKKPTSIADVYGSRWITAAAGSVLSLWGAPGDPVVELRHLKQPAGEVGPFLVQIDHETGWVAMAEGTDLLGHLRASKNGLTAKEAGSLMEGGSERAREVKARRRLAVLETRRLAYRRPGEAVRGGVHEPDRYFATPENGA